MPAILTAWLIQDSDTVHQDYGFVFQDGFITRIAPNKEIQDLAKEQNEQIIDLTDCVVCPGFINTHMHQYGILSHGMQPQKPIPDFETFLKDYWWPNLENKLRKEDVVLTAKFTCAEQAESGITSFCDILEAPLTEQGTLIAQGEAIQALGMRAIVSLESSERISSENGEACLQENLRAVRHFKHQSSLVRGAICTHTTFTCSPEFIQKAAKIAELEDSLFQFHLSESLYEPRHAQEHFAKKPTVIYAEQQGLSPRTLATQCVQIDAEEIAILLARQTKIAHMPLSNCEVGGGFAPVPEMLAAGLCVGLGTDGYINDFFEVMRGAFLMHKSNKLSPEAMPAKLVFSMATAFGAQCLQIEKLGKLQTGFHADFIAVQNRFPTPITHENIFDQLVVHGKKEYLKASWVAGKQLYLRGKPLYPGLAKDHIRLKKSANKLWNSQS